jgi:hypothetical protein
MSLLLPRIFLKVIFLLSILNTTYTITHCFCTDVLLSMNKPAETKTNGYPTVSLGVRTDQWME